MKGRSFLIAEYDPFIVIPVTLLTRKERSVRAEGRRLCGRGAWRETLSVDRRRRRADVQGGRGVAADGPADQPEGVALQPAGVRSDGELPGVSGSRDEKKGPPDYASGGKRCTELLNEVGGLGEGYSLFQWEDLLPKEEEEAGGEGEADATVRDAGG